MVSVKNPPDLNPVSWHPVSGSVAALAGLRQLSVTGTLPSSPIAPVTFDTCEVIEECWANWMRQDPVVAIETQADNLRRLKALYIDCGEKDQFNLLYGARRFVRRLNELGIAHRYEEFPDNHTAVDYRMDERLPFLAQALST
jgi:hypothetical protein